MMQRNMSSSRTTVLILRGVVKRPSHRPTLQRQFSSVVILDDTGSREIYLPGDLLFTEESAEHLERMDTVSYSLTALHVPMPDLHVREELHSIAVDKKRRRRSHSRSHTNVGGGSVGHR